MYNRDMSDLPTISSRSNPLVKQVRALRQRKTRKDTGTFLVEGIHHVGQAVEANWEVEVLLYSPKQLNSDYAIALVDRARRDGIRCQPVSKLVAENMAEKDHPQGILAVVRVREWNFEKLTARAPRRMVACVSPQDPGNVGAILRTIDAVGADGLFLLDGGVDPFHPSVIRASMGTIFWKPVVQADYGAFVQWAEAGNYHIIGASCRASLDYRQLEPQPPWILLLGSEQKGLSEEQLQACTVGVSLPMYGKASSLNLAVSAGILLYEFGDKK